MGNEDNVTATKKKAKTTTKATKPHQWTDGGDKVLILRRCNADGTSRNGFTYPKSGMVEAPDFNDRTECGGGLHGWPWGWALGEGMDYDIIGDSWLVLAALPDDVIGEIPDDSGGIGGKCKCRKAEVVFHGAFAAAWAMINGGRHRLIDAMSKDGSPEIASGNSSKAASSGDSSKAASSGDSSTAASSGNSSTAASSGDSSTAASSGNSSTAASSGDYSKAASSGNYSKAASSGNYSTAASSGNYSKAEAKGENTVACCAGSGCAVKVGRRGAFAIPYYTTADGWRFLCGKVGEGGIEADVWYVVQDGKLVKQQ